MDIVPNCGTYQSIISHIVADRSHLLRVVLLGGVGAAELGKILEFLSTDELPPRKSCRKRDAHRGRCLSAAAELIVLSSLRSWGGGGRNRMWLFSVPTLVGRYVLQALRGDLPQRGRRTAGTRRKPELGGVFKKF